MANISFEETVHAYMSAALWSSDLDDALERILSEDTALQMREDCRAFMSQNALLLAASGLSASQVGHDFWLSRNRHGAGFWDRGLGQVGDALTAASQALGGAEMYVGDDGLLYICNL